MIKRYGIMTINEKLEGIAILESENLSQEMIENIINNEEHPEKRVGPFKTVEEAMEYLESEDDE